MAISSAQAPNLDDYGTDLDTALALIARLRADREEERARADAAEGRLAQLEQEVGIWRQRAAEAEAAQRDLVETHQRMVGEWRAEMTTRAREFDILRQEVRAHVFVS